MTTNASLRNTHRALYVSMTTDALLAEQAQINAKIEKLAKRSQARADEYAAFMADALALIADVLAERN